METWKKKAMNHEVFVVVCWSIMSPFCCVSTSFVTGSSPIKRLLHIESIVFTAKTTHSFCWGVCISNFRPAQARSKRTFQCFLINRLSVCKWWQHLPIPRVLGREKIPDFLDEWKTTLNEKKQLAQIFCMPWKRSEFLLTWKTTPKISGHLRKRSSSFSSTISTRISVWRDRFFQIIWNSTENPFCRNHSLIFRSNTL